MNRPRFKEGDVRFRFENAKPNFTFGSVKVGSWVARPSRMSGPNLQSSPFCQICNIQFFTEEQLSCHLLSKEHFSKAEDRNFVKTMQKRDLEMRKELYKAANEEKFSQEEALINSIKQLEIKEKPNDTQLESRLFHCPVCNVDLNSISQAKQHLSGSRHLKFSKDVNPLKRKMLETPFVGTSKKTAKKSFYCAVCDMELNSISQADAHFASSKHQKRDMEFPASNKSSSENSQGKCSICDVDFTSEVHAQDHYNGKKHAAKLRENQMPETPSHSASDQLQAQNSERTSLDIKIEDKETRKDAPETFEPIWSAQTPEIPQSQPSVNTSETPEILLHCQLCRLSVNSESQLKAHHTSKRHLQAVQAITRRGCGRGRGFMLNQLKQSLTSPGQQKGSEHGKLFQPPSGFQVPDNQSKSVSGFLFTTTTPGDETY